MFDEHSYLTDIARRLLQYDREGSTALAAAPVENDAGVYTDADLFARERQALFLKTPQLICFSSDLPEAGSYRSWDALGVPMLLVRGDDGQVRAFLNSCAHRGMRLGEFQVQTNWKLALDTFCEGYHFASLHKDSVGDYALSNISDYLCFGAWRRSHRLAFPNTTIRELHDRPESDWGDADAIFSQFQLVHFILRCAEMPRRISISSGKWSKTRTTGLAVACKPILTPDSWRGRPSVATNRH